MNFLSPILGPNAPLAATFIVAFAVVLVLIGLTAWVFRLLRGRGLGIGSGGRGRQPRLAVLDYADVDARRKLVLIRRDNVEHLLLLGGPTDVVVETAIVRGMPVPATALRDMPAAAAELSAIEPNTRKTPRDVAREAAGEPAVMDVEKPATLPIEAAPLAAPPRVAAPVMPKPEVNVPRPVPPRFEPPKVEAPRIPSPTTRPEPPSFAPPISASPKIDIPPTVPAPEPVVAPRAAPMAAPEPVIEAPAAVSSAPTAEPAVVPPAPAPAAPPKVAAPIVPPAAPRPMPPRPPETRPAAGDDDITSRLEAVLRKPMTPPSLSSQRPVTPPARPLTPPVASTPTPAAPVSTEASAVTATPEPTAPMPLSATDKSVFDSLEEEMAALLGRGPTPPKS
ncbi:MAG: flagellar biosynthesis protein FliO [Alphaproteobacteria bacterium]|jgi:hypothetical protein